jgi:hypothetical protein
MSVHRLVVGVGNGGRDARLAVLAGRQGAAFSFNQALELGFPRATIHRRLASGAWTRLFAGVYTFGGSETTRLQQIWAAVLAAGTNAAVTHETAGLCHGAERLSSEPITLTNPHRWHHRLDGVFVHQIDDLLPRHLVRWNGLRMSSPARVVVELGATQPEAVIGRVADDFLRMRKTTTAAISSVFADVARPGKPGVERIARILDERSDGYVPPHSELERIFFDVLAAGGLPPPVRQFPLPGRGRLRGIADGAYLDAQMILEVDGRRWHARMQAARADAERDADAASQGWQTLRFVFEQVVYDPLYVCRVVADTRASRLQLFRRSA